jgi:hypothetical protein
MRERAMTRTDAEAESVLPVTWPPRRTHVWRIGFGNLFAGFNIGSEPRALPSLPNVSPPPAKLRLYIFDLLNNLSQYKYISHSPSEDSQHPSPSHQSSHRQPVDAHIDACFGGRSR